MIISDNIAHLRNLLSEHRLGGRSTGLVPTMGNLHAGHIKLVTTAKSEVDFVVATIFVNPLQFGPGEDLEAYPRTPERDIAVLRKAGCDCLFSPPTNEIYPRGLGRQTTIRVPELTEAWCGNSRPGHFQGVATVVTKLFNIVQPHVAYFGLKDYQQYLVISKLVRDLAYSIRIVGVDTVREPDGLAMSSRNQYLQPAQRRQAPLLYRQLEDTAAALQTGSGKFEQLQQEAISRFRSEGIEPDYYAICNASTLRPARPDDPELIILAAVFIGKTRLIDNLRVSRKAVTRAN
ncbi:MAG: pantoate--beta-alanine ligase [Pseudohongiellaceae bacterium]